MRKVIYKYPIWGNVHSIGYEVEMPLTAKILTVEPQNGQLTIWAEVDPDDQPVRRDINGVGTGHPVPEGEYLTTVQQGSYVWHLYLPT